MIPSTDTLFLIQFTATALMTGIIWFVQIVHYPLFGRIPTEGFTRYERAHAVRTGWVVAPLMLLELATAISLFLLQVPIASTPPYLGALGCLLLIWASTFLIQVPLHGILEKHPDAPAMRRLVTTNWIRTLLWSVRLGLLASLLSALPQSCIPSDFSCGIPWRGVTSPSFKISPEPNKTPISQAHGQETR